MNDRFPPPLAHGDLEEIYPDVFFVTGMSEAELPGEGLPVQSQHDGGARGQVTHARQHLCASTPPAWSGSTRSAKVENVVRIGAFHGRDDAFYADRYHAPLWALPGTKDEHGATIDKTLSAGSLPLGHCKLFAFETPKAPEAILLLERNGGILVSCDSLQNWLGGDRFFDDESTKMMGEFGFFKAANVGPAWKRQADPKAADFAALKSLSARRLLERPRCTPPGRRARPALLDVQGAVRRLSPRLPQRPSAFLPEVDLRALQWYERAVFFSSRYLRRVRGSLFSAQRRAPTCAFGPARGRVIR